MVSDKFLCVLSKLIEPNSKQFKVLFLIVWVYLPLSIRKYCEYLLYRADKEEKLAYEATLTTNSTSKSEDLTEMRNRNISIYGALVVGTFLLSLAAAVAFLYIAVSSSQNLHNKMFKKLLGATTYFFDTNPAGECS